MNHAIFRIILLSSAALSVLAAQPALHKTENIIFVMTDGFRLQELFNGAEESLLGKEHAGESSVGALKEAYWRNTPAARREALMPFLWGTVAKNGQIYGNRALESEAFVTNGKNFSYPGYSEILCGFPDPKITSNDKILNDNVTVLEWLHRKPAFRNKVAAFGAWDLFPYIFNAARAGFPVNAGYDPFTAAPLTPTLELLNQLKAEAPRVWPGEAFDSLPFHTALEYLKEQKPRVLYLVVDDVAEKVPENLPRPQIGSSPLLPQQLGLRCGSESKPKGPLASITSNALSQIRHLTHQSSYGTPVLLRIGPDLRWRRYSEPVKKQVVSKD